MIEHTAKIHKKKHCKDSHDNELFEDSKNCITRLITNEFSFYTSKPLELKDFTQLQEKILILATQKPVNLHLILASFAVRLSNNTVINVVPYIECGQCPSIKLLVKNYSALSDPMYQDLHGIEIKNFDIRENDTLEFTPLEINGKVCEFTKNNVFECITAAGDKLLVCCDICVDYYQKVGFYNFNKILFTVVSNILQEKTQTGTFPSQFSHVIVSDFVNPDAGIKIGNSVFADTMCSTRVSKPGVVQKNISNMKSNFGPSFELIDTEPTACNSLLNRKNGLPYTFSAALSDIIYKQITFDNLVARLSNLEKKLEATMDIDKIFSLDDKATGYLYVIIELLNNATSYSFFLNNDQLKHKELWSRTKAFSATQSKLKEALEKYYSNYKLLDQCSGVKYNY